jgi:hypothetical protein
MKIRILTLALATYGSSSGAAGQERFTTLYSFTAGSPLGLVAAEGALYGATSAVAPVGNNCGSVFELLPPTAPGDEWTETVLHAFTGNGDGCTPIGPPALGPDQALYGVTNVGGAYDAGAVYQVRPPASPGQAWTESIIYSFDVVAADPVSLIVRGNQSLYVATMGGGANANGSLVELQRPNTPGGTWTATVLYSFPGDLSEGDPTSLILAPDGLFYGTIPWTGTSRTDAGAVFQLTPPSAPGGTWTETVICNFHGGDDGATPNSLTIAEDGTIYGTTFGTSLIGGYAGFYGVGTVFKLTRPASPGGAWTKTILHQFGQGELHGPNSPVILYNGNIYGTTTSPDGGFAFELQPPSSSAGDWTAVFLHEFTGGEMPGGALVMDGSGALYGATQIPYAEPPQGTAYKIAPE